MEWKKEEEVGGEEEEKKKEAKVCEYFLSNFLSNLSYNERKIYFLTSEFSRIVIFCMFNFSKAGFWDFSYVSLLGLHFLKSIK